MPTSKRPMPQPRRATLSETYTLPTVLLFLLLFSVPLRSQPTPMPPPAVGTVSVPAPGAAAQPLYQAASTKEMARRLADIYASTDWKLDPNKAAQRVAYYTQLLQSRALTLPDDTVGR